MMNLNSMKIPIGLFCVIWSSLGFCQPEGSFLMHIAFRQEIEELEQNGEWYFHKGPIEENVYFYLYTRQSKEPCVLQPKNTHLFDKSDFNIRKPTKVLIHGYFSNIRFDMVQGIKNNFLETEDVNVIAVDWTKISNRINYFAVTKKLAEVGNYVAQMLDFLVTEGCDPREFHLIGHSLGAHVAGFAATFAQLGKPQRITGLDPAGPGFNHVEPSKRLDSSDADFVDCIHTCAGLLGIRKSMCDVDFYPNGGRNVQPGCHHFDFGRCSHLRSHYYFAESILPSHKFPAVPYEASSNFQDFLSNSTVYMGYYVSHRARGKYLVHTNRRYPYANVHP